MTIRFLVSPEDALRYNWVAVIKDKLVDSIHNFKSYERKKEAFISKLDTIKCEANELNEKLLAVRQEIIETEDELYYLIADTLENEALAKKNQHKDDHAEKTPCKATVDETSTDINSSTHNEVPCEKTVVLYSTGDMEIPMDTNFAGPSFSLGLSQSSGDKNIVDPILENKKTYDECQEDVVAATLGPFSATEAQLRLQFKNQNFDEEDYIFFFPYGQHEHWVLFCIDIPRHKIWYFNSLNPKEGWITDKPTMKMLWYYFRTIVRHHSANDR
ncbi:uncharacterized protein LOC127266273 [Andrographis paniculata]|uniref:uncharacterized protein LOC127266273 n=1 Tax=Andrographis paniculata TaxID=175694 RepID=UPI0021E6E857|nr:uncharacterized protein LOC127266273 [Andrographis paniculata]